jgi:hypothetical protein
MGPHSLQIKYFQIWLNDSKEADSPFPGMLTD